MWKNVVQPARPGMTIWCMRFESWVPKTANTHPEYVIRFAFPLQRCLHEGALMLCYTHIARPFTICLFLSILITRIFGNILT